MATLVTQLLGRSDGRRRMSGGSRRTLMGLIGVLALVLTACPAEDDGVGEEGQDSDDEVAVEDSEGSDDETDTSGGVAEACTEDLAGGSVTMGMWSQPSAMDPVDAGGVGATGGIEGLAVWDSLMEYDPETTEFSPRVAEDLVPNDDFTEWTLTLPPDVEFGNGDPLTADAVKASIERHQDPENGSLVAPMADFIAGMTVVDDLTLEIELTDAWPGFPIFLADQGGWVTNPAVIEEMSEEEFAAEPVGAGVGPYEVSRFAEGDEIVLTAKDDWWGGPVCIEELHFTVIEGSPATFDAFQQGEIDMAWLRDPSVNQRARDEGVNGHSFYQSAGEALAMNMSAAPTDDQRVRRAVQLALDLDAINDRTDDGAALPSSSLIWSESQFHGDVSGPEHDREAAAALVEEAKADTDWDGQVEIVCLDDSRRVDQMIATQAQLEAVGFDVELTNVGTGELVQRLLVDRDFQIGCFGYGIYPEALWERLNQFFRSDSPQNFKGLDSAEIDEAIVDIRAAVELSEVQDAVDVIQTEWNETAPGAMMFAVEERVIWGDHVQGLDFEPAYKGTFRFDEAFLEQ